MIRDTINAYMWENNISKKDLELSSGVGYTTICKYLNGKYDIRVHNLERILKGLNLKLRI